LLALVSVIGFVALIALQIVELNTYKSTPMAAPVAAAPAAEAAPAP
jgi:hypothetical protein